MAKVSRYNIKGRLAMVGMTGRQLVEELNKRGVKCVQSELSQALYWGINPKHELICREADKILAEKEERYK